MDEMDDVLSWNIDLRCKLKEKREKLVEAKESRKKAEGLATSSA